MTAYKSKNMYSEGQESGQCPDKFNEAEKKGPYLLSLSMYSKTPFCMLVWIVQKTPFYKGECNVRIF